MPDRGTGAAPPATPPPARTGRRRRFAWASLGLFVALTVVHTWPLAEAPGTWSRNDNADTVLHEWTIAWIAHKVVADPLHLFDANIFHPDRLTLAYSDHLVMPGIFVAPVIWAGGSPVLAHNLLLMAGFVLTGWSFSLLVHRWTGHATAAILSGSLAAFNAARLTSLPQIQGLHLEFLAFALLAFDGTLRVPGVGRAARLAVWFALQGMASGYWLLFTSLAMVAGAAARWKAVFRVGSGGRRAWPYLVLAGIVAAMLLAPVLMPYWIVSRDQGLVRTIEDVATYSAQWTDYLATGGRLHFEWWSRRFYEDDALFPGVIGLGLTLVAVGSGIVLHNVRARMVLVITLMAFALSFGPAFPLYEPLFNVFPLMAIVRGAAWFGHLVLVGVAILAGFGLVSVQRALRRHAHPLGRRLAAPIGIVLLIGAHVEAIRAPFAYTTYEELEAEWDELANTGDSVLAFFPFYPATGIFQNTRYMLPSSRAWRPMLNGYSGFTPLSYRRHADALASFPEASSIAYLREVGVTHVVILEHLMSAERMAAVERSPDLFRVPPFDAPFVLYVVSR